MFQVSRLSKDQITDDAAHKLTICTESNNIIVELHIDADVKEATYMQPYSGGTMFR